LQDQIASLQAQAADPANAGRKTQLLAGADAGKQKLDQLTTAASFYDTFVTSITTPDASGIAPIAAITQELAIDTMISGGTDVLLLHLENTGGGYLVKKNLLTALGSPPLYHTGGATATYLLIRGTDGEVLDGDIVPIHGGYVQSKDLAETLARI
jgi:hypothetical protein